MQFDIVLLDFTVDLSQTDLTIDSLKTKKKSNIDPGNQYATKLEGSWEV